MNSKNPLLLPSGLYDLLPPKAHMESNAAQRLLACFESFGYLQVSPPLLEFETSLLSGRGEALASQTFRIMDPSSQSMMGFRADMTLQVARIAEARMASASRPLRLCYAGPILRIKPESLKNERQLLQAGIELIGVDSPEADAEVIIVAAEAMTGLGIKDISIDINLPGLLGELCPEAKDDASLRQQIKDAIQRRDAGEIARLPVKNNALLAALVEAAGPADKAIALLKKLGLKQAGALATLVARLKHSCPYVTLTLDPIEYRGFDYHQGIGFSIFAAGVRHELGRGGRYFAGHESATGFSLYVTHLLPLLAPPPEKKRILVTQNTKADEAHRLREQGWATLSALTDASPAEAKRLGCTHIFDKGKIEAL